MREEWLQDEGPRHGFYICAFDGGDGVSVRRMYGMTVVMPKTWRQPSGFSAFISSQALASVRTLHVLHSRHSDLNGDWPQHLGHFLGYWGLEVYTRFTDTAWIRSWWR